MGQCSTLPAEGRNEQSSMSSSYSKFQQQRDDVSSSHHRYRVQNMTDGSDNSTTPLTERHRMNRRPTGYTLQVNTVPQSEQSGQFGHMQAHTIQPPTTGFSIPQTSDPTVPTNRNNNNNNAQHQQRNQALPPPHPPQQRQTSNSTQLTLTQEDRLPPPPDAAVRTRCYKLNLESEFIGIGHDESRLKGHILGPFTDTIPPLTYSDSTDSNQEITSTSVAIQTAQIFRGISIAEDGTILAQNARATRSNRGSKSKRGEKSRQAAKIDKAKDLVEESVRTGKAPDSKEPANMVSLVSMGEYDEMKYLVRDGSKKLRESSGLPDEALLAVNRPRGPKSPYHSPIMSPSRKRVSPFVNGGGSQPTTPKSPKSRHNLPSSAPPKIKGHPRDYPSQRRLTAGDRQGSRRFLQMEGSCNNMFPDNTEGDWSSSLNLSRGFNSIWNCGNSGTISPTQMAKEQKGHMSPRHQNIIVDGRNDSSYRMTQLGRMDSERIEAPGHTVRT